MVNTKRQAPESNGKHQKQMVNTKRQAPEANGKHKPPTTRYVGVLGYLETLKVKTES